MLYLSQILDAAKALHEISPEKAAEFGYKSSGVGDDTGGYSWEEIWGTGKKIKISRGASWSGSTGEPQVESPRLEIAGTTVSLDFLSDKTRKELDQKMQAAFSDLFNTLKFEREVAPLRKKELEAAERCQREASQQKHDQEVGRLISTL